MSDNLRFTADPEDLARLACLLRDIVPRMTEAKDIAARYEPPDLGPTPGVSVELASFHSNWSDGMAKIKANIAVLAARLTGAAQAYHATDDAITRRASSAGGGPQ